MTSGDAKPTFFATTRWILVCDAAGDGDRVNSRVCLSGAGHPWWITASAVSSGEAEIFFLPSVY